MSPFTTFIILILGSWSSIHLIHRFYVPANPPRGVLPTYLTSNSSGTTSRRRKSTPTTVTLNGPYLRVESTAFNSTHDALALWFSQQKSRTVRATLRATFDLGVAVSLLGMALALAMLAWTFVQLARRSVANLVPRPTTDVYPHAKRSYESAYVPPSTFPARPATDIPIQLLVRTPLLPPPPYMPTASLTLATQKKKHISDTRNHAAAFTTTSPPRRAVLLASHTRSGPRPLSRAVRPTRSWYPNLITDGLQHTAMAYPSSPSAHP
jgi:hypothetical protein